MRQPKYASQSGEIFGVLEQMLEQFQNTRKEEGQKNKDAIANFNERESVRNGGLSDARHSSCLDHLIPLWQVVGRVHVAP